MLHGSVGSVGTWLNGVKTSARSSERTSLSVGGGLIYIYEMQWVQNASSLCALCVSLS